MKIGLGNIIENCFSAHLYFNSLFIFGKKSTNTEPHYTSI